jgi:hypothetical protein
MLNQCDRISQKFIACDKISGDPRIAIINNRAHSILKVTAETISDASKMLLLTSLIAQNEDTSNRMRYISENEDTNEVFEAHLLGCVTP